MPTVLATPEELLPSGSTDASRPCRGCSRPRRRLPDQAVPSFTALLRQGQRRMVSPPPESSAHHGAPGLDLTPFCNPTIEDVLADSLSIDCQPLTSLLVASCPAVTAP